MFSPPAFITIGDEYDKRDQIPERYKGKNFKCSPCKKGTLPDALFSKKYQSLCEGDKYVDPGFYEKRQRLESERKKLTPVGFKYTNPSHRSTGSGSYFGTFCEKNPPKHEVEYAVSQKTHKPDAPVSHARNFITNPPKRGTYGFPSTTIGHGDEYKYVSDPYDSEKRREALKSKESATKIAGPPFKAACKRSGFFDETPHGVSRVFSIDKALPAKRPQTEERKAPLAKAWRPAGTLVAEITKYPEYQEDPYEAKERVMRESRKSKINGPQWKPIGGSHSLPTKPIKFTPS